MDQRDYNDGEGGQQLVAPQAVSIPAYGKRKAWKPRKQEDFGDGGSYPECHIAQYPLEMGRKKAVSVLSFATGLRAEWVVRLSR